MSVGRKAIKKEVVMKTELKVEDGYRYDCEIDETGCLIVVRRIKQKYAKKEVNKPIEKKETAAVPKTVENPSVPVKSPEKTV